jgi:hypothetical protein
MPHGVVADDEDADRDVSFTKERVADISGLNIIGLVDATALMTSWNCITV